MSLLITGGAGYIGRHTAKLLQESGEEVVLLDNLSTGQPTQPHPMPLIVGDIADRELVRGVLEKHSVSTVIHLAASAHVGESIRQPGLYFRNNVSATFSLLDAMLSVGVKRFIFASSCSVYGAAHSSAAHEDDLAVPLSPYGESKLALERALPWYATASGLQWISLRYFNVAGAEDNLGELVSTSTRIIPRAVHAVSDGGRPLNVFGVNHPTIDGSPVRDFVHVTDVARANLSALRYLEQGESGDIVNIGSGVGLSVLQIVRAVAAQAGRPVPLQLKSAATGDPPYTVSDTHKSQRLLRWRAQMSDIETLVASVFRSLDREHTFAHSPR